MTTFTLNFWDTEQTNPALYACWECPPPWDPYCLNG
jgi:hypothetical protein